MTFDYDLNIINGGGLSFGEKKNNIKLKTDKIPDNAKPEKIIESIYEASANSECRPDIISDTPGVCSDKKVINKLKEYLSTVSNKDVDTLKPIEIIDLAKSHSNVNYESELYDLPTLSEFDKDDYFNIAGPWDNDEWLNNINIDDTLDRWENVFKFRNIGVHMNNFEEEHKKLAQIDLKQDASKYNIAASVINTDNYGQPGQHWVCIVIDHNNKTIEYFDSGAGDISNEIFSWITKKAIELNYNDIYNNVKHQELNTECGVYCLFYIICRIHGIPQEYFDRIKINDEIMLKLMRKYLFRYSN